MDKQIIEGAPPGLVVMVVRESAQQWRQTRRYLW